MTADAPPSRRRRSVPLIVGAIVAAIALVGGGWFAARVFTSPEQRAAAAAAPSAAPILVRVESGDLADTRTLSGTIRSTDSFAASLAPLKDADRSVVTSVPAATGHEVAVGSVVATVNGQPVFAMQSPFALYRDLGVGDSGVDVRALQDSLVSAGLLSSADGKFGPATAAAVATLFARAGFDVPLRDGAMTPAATATATPAADDTAGAAQTDAQPPHVVYFPAAAVLTVPALPAVVASSPAVGADAAAGANFEFQAQTLAVFATLPASLPAGLAPGTKVVVSGAGLDKASATVHGVATSADVVTPPADTAGAADDAARATAAPTSPQGHAGASQATESEVRIDLDDGALLKREQAGQSVTVTATVKVIAKDALVVPIAAVDEDDPTHGYVVLASASGRSERVAVTILGTVGGRVALKPGESLAEGDEVRVG